MLRDYTRRLLNGSTRQEGRGRRIKGIVELYFAFEAQLLWLVITGIIVYFLRPEGDVTLQIGPLTVPSVNLSILTLFLIIAIFWIRSEYRALHCEYPGNS